VVLDGIGFSHLECVGADAGVRARSRCWRGGRRRNLHVAIKLIEQGPTTTLIYEYGHHAVSADLGDEAIAILDTCIPLPELSEQRGIAGRWEQQPVAPHPPLALELTTPFFRRFLGLFGDPKKNPTSGRASILSRLLEVSDGPFGSNLKSSITARFVCPRPCASKISVSASS